MRKILLFSLLFTAAHTLRAQVTDSIPGRNPRHSFFHGEVDTSYIRVFTNTVTGRVYLGEKISNFTLRDREHDYELAYKANAVLALGVGITYRGIGLNISTKLPFHDTKEDMYGKTQRYDLQVHRYRRKTALDMYLQRYKGYHLNDKTLDPGFKGETEYPYYARMRNLTLGATMLYLFNGERFSIRGAVNQQERQLKSAGSPMVGASFFFRQFSNGDSSLIPGSYPNTNIFEGRNPMKIQTYGLTLHGGYGYTLVWARNWFANITADVGIGAGYDVVTEKAGTTTKGFDLQGRANLRASIGYATTDWTVGLYGIAVGDRSSLPYEQTDISSTQGIGRLVVARRFPHVRQKGKL